mmetsp:Transcript_30249/g.74352  ORF Transcript_30249/g.74352 Transcript_30249/m.74352 type:complete len:383 (-) Transcript_30249:497-1645(-)
MDAPIYLDYNATTPLDPKVQAAMLPYLQGRFGNPSSGHWYGVKEKAAVNGARKDIADLLGAAPGEITFTSGGTESVNWALKGVAEQYEKTKGKHIITSSVEHVVVLECCKYLAAAHGFEITYVGVDSTGCVDPEDVKKAIRPDTVLVTIMHANNETGSINDVKRIAAIALEAGVLSHTDASQSVGKVAIDVKDLGVDMLTVAGHKLYAPAGVGVLYLRTGVSLPVWMHGAGHEAGRRAGTENTMHMVALGTACRLCREGMAAHVEHMRSVRDLLHEELRGAFPDIVLNGNDVARLPNTLNVSFPATCPTSFVLIQATAPTVAFSAGSACHAADECHISHVLAAMGVDKTRAARACRFSTGRFTSAEHIRIAAAAIIKAAQGK